MSLRAGISILLVLATSVPAGHARAQSPPKPAKPADTAKPPTQPAQPARAAKPKASTARAGAASGAVGRAGVAPRRLEDIQIQGEIPAPQVLFITARDQRRFLGSQHRRFLRTARELGEATPLPSEVIVTRPEPMTPKAAPAPEGSR
jgi:hypothetical protein